MNKFVKGAAALLAMSAIIVGCSKYDEGPGLSLRTKKGRIAGDWGLEAYIENGTDKTSDYRQFTSSETMTYEKDGNFLFDVTTILGNFKAEGTWEFINDKVDVKTTTTKQNGVTLTTPSVDTAHLIRLTNKEMWSKETNGSNTYEYHYSSK